MREHREAPHHKESKTAREQEVYEDITHEESMERKHSNEPGHHKRKKERQGEHEVIRVGLGFI